MAKTCLSTCICTQNHIYFIYSILPWTIAFHHLVFNQSINSIKFQVVHSIRFTFILLKLLNAHWMIQLNEFNKGARWTVEERRGVSETVLFMRNTRVYSTSVFACLLEYVAFDEWAQKIVVEYLIKSTKLNWSVGREATQLVQLRFDNCSLLQQFNSRTYVVLCIGVSLHCTTLAIIPRWFLIFINVSS